MSKIEYIIISFKNLSDEEQLKLFTALDEFCYKEFPAKKCLIVTPITFKEKKVKK